MCLIGLEIDNNTFKWDDNTNINKEFINNNLCKQYNFINNIYYIYIDKNLTCWQAISSNLFFQACTICGPKMYDETGGYYWWLNIYIPLILSIIALIYSIYICKSLQYNLYYIEHNWIKDKEPNKKVKCTAISLSILLATISFMLIIYYLVLIIGY